MLAVKEGCYYKLNRKVRVGLVERMTFEQGLPKAGGKANQQVIRNSVAFKGDSICEDTETGMFQEQQGGNCDCSDVIEWRRK